MLSGVEDRIDASREAAEAMPAEQSELLDDFSERTPPPDHLEPPEVSIEPPDLGGRELPDFRTAHVPPGADFAKPIAPRYIVDRGQEKPPSQDRMFEVVRRRMERPGAAARRGEGRRRPQAPEPKHEPAQQYPDDPLFDDDQLTEIGTQQGRVGGAGSRNREGQAEVWREQVELNEVMADMLINFAREIAELRMALERYRG